MTSIKLGKLLKRTFGAGSLKISQSVWGILISILLTRLLGVAGFGVYSFGISVATILAIPTSKGISELVVREVARAKQTENWSFMKAILLWSTGFVFIYSAVVGTIIAIIAPSIDSENLLGRAALYSIIIVPLISLTGIWAGGLRGLKYPGLSLLPEGFLRPVFLLSFLLITGWLSSLIFTAYNALMLFVIAAAIVVLCSAAMLIKVLPREVWSRPVSKGHHKKWLKLALPFAAIGGLMVVNRQVDLILLGVFMSETEVGLYRIAILGGMLILFGSQAINIVLSPYFAEHNKSQDRENIVELMRMSIFFSFSIALFATVFLIIFGKWILAWVYSPAFLESYKPLIILSFANTVVALNGAIIALLNMTGNQNQTLRAFSFSVGINVILNTIFIIYFGILGAAIATMISLIIWSYLLRKAAIKSLNLDPIRIFLNLK